MIPVKQKNPVKPRLTPQKLFLPPGNGKEATALKSQLTISQLEGEGGVEVRADPLTPFFHPN